MTEEQYAEAQGWLIDLGVEVERALSLTMGQTRYIVEKNYEGGWQVFVQDACLDD